MLPTRLHRDRVVVAPTACAALSCRLALPPALFFVTIKSNCHRHATSFFDVPPLFKLNVRELPLLPSDLLSPVDRQSVLLTAFFAEPPQLTAVPSEKPRCSPLFIDSVKG
jgi:hypothetical protein